MKNKLLGLVLAITLFTGSSVHAFRDVTVGSKLDMAIERLVDQGSLEDKGFFRPDSEVPAILFWQILIGDTGFNPKSATFNTPLPSNVSEEDVIAPYLREAIRRGLISSETPFDSLAPIKRSEALSLLLKTKGILPPKKASKVFIKKVSRISPLAKILPVAESAYASKIIYSGELSHLNPNDNLSRRDLVMWLYNWQANGSLKNSSLDLTPLQKKSIEKTKYPYQQRKNAKRSSRKKPVNLRIEPLSNTAPTRNGENLNIQVLAAVFDEIERRYKFDDTLDQAKKDEIINTAIASMVKGIGDKYSSYIEPQKAADFKDSLNGEFEGIGAYVEMINDRFTITAPIKGSPAEAAGVLAGDIVNAVDGVSITGLSIREIVDKVRGPSGSKVKLDIIRNGRGLPVTVVRGKITVPSTTIMWKKGIPIIGIHQFTRDTGVKLETMILNEVLPKNPKGLIFDLRNNPGGFLTSAVDVGSLFLKKDAPIFKVEYKSGEQVYPSLKDGILSDFKGKVVFLQNKGSASASEITTAMIQDYKIGTIVGMSSLGKGTVQEVLNYANGGTLKLTIAKWLSPKNRWIHLQGVTPDVQVSDPTAEEKSRKIDRQIDTALNSILNR